MAMEMFAHIAQELGVKAGQVEATARLLDEGNTVPFIARYRKEATGELDDEKVRLVDERLRYLRALDKRKQEILASITEQGKLTPELEAAIGRVLKLQELEDLYLPYKPKKRTRAQIAKERGLEPLAEIVLAQELTSGDPLEIAKDYVDAEKGVATPEDALAGAADIIAEQVSERADFRAQLRKQLWNQAAIHAVLIVEDKDAPEFLNYRDYTEPVRQMPAHRILAINRGEVREVLKVDVVTPHETHMNTLLRQMTGNPSIFTEHVRAAVVDGYKRLLYPSLERELRSLLSENAEKQSIKLFGLNLRQLLLQAPLNGHVVMGLDPGYRTGCKMAVVGATGAVLATGTLFFTMSDGQKKQAEEAFLKTVREQEVTLVSIGNGTASYETEEFVAGLIASHQLNLHYLIVNEAGASVYSASKLAREELPDLDVTIRGAVSIARRVQDPLAELVKIEPKAIGVGQYQHDVNQKELGEALGQVVESAVNSVGVEINTASAELLSYVAGINAAVANNIIKMRDLNGRFASRKSLLKVPRLGPAAFTQCAGFIRVRGGDNPLDNTPVHPESYALAETILNKMGFALRDLADTKKLPELMRAASQADPAALARELEAGEPTIRDILAALARPGRDPREDLPAPLTRRQVTKLSELAPGSIVRGSVHNVTDFGVFVDIGVKTNGLIHRSELSDKAIRHPMDAVSVGDVIDCMILAVDEARNRISLSLKQAKRTS